MNILIQNKKNQKKYHYKILIFSFLLMIGSLILKIIIPLKIEDYCTKKLTSFIPSEIQIPFSNLVDYFDSIHPIIILGIVIYNIQNVYKSLVLFNMPCMMCYLMSFFQILFKSPLRKVFRGVLKEYGYSFPNYYIIMVVTFYFSLWYIFFYNKNYHCLSKYVSLFSLNIFFIFIMFGHVVSGMHYIFEIILSVIFSYGFCIFILIGLNLKLDNSEELCNIINFKISFYILIYFCSFFLLLFIYFIRKNERGYDNLLNKSLINSSYFYGGLFSIFGIKSEIYFIFEGKNKYWKQCNFDNSEKDNFYNVSILKDKIWNSTTPKKTIFRIIYFLICSLLFIIPFYLFIKTTENIILNYLIFWLESSIVMYGNFFLFKLFIIKKECLVNDIFFEGFEEKPLL